MPSITSDRRHRYGNATQADTDRSPVAVSQPVPISDELPTAGGDLPADPGAQHVVPAQAGDRRQQGRGLRDRELEEGLDDLLTRRQREVVRGAER
jgi:hypothetical protein